jgi:hypothetical protein
MSVFVPRNLNAADLHSNILCSSYETTWTWDSLEFDLHFFISLIQSPTTYSTIVDKGESQEWKFVVCLFTNTNGWVAPTKWKSYSFWHV